MRTSPHAVVRTSELTRRFRGRVAVDDVSLAIAPGEIFGLVGPNGAGKTTLIRVLCATLRPTSGHAWVLDHEVGADPEGVRRHIGYMSQTFSLYRELTVAENLRFYGDVYGGVPERRAREVSMTVGLDERDLQTRVGDLATGVRQRAALAAAVLHDPQLLFLDEPTSGVDPAGRRDFWTLMRTLAGNGTTIVTSTHVMADVERSDRVALMNHGRVLACASPAELRALSGTAIAVIEADPWTRAYAQLKQRFPATTLRGERIHVPIAAGVDPALVIMPALHDVAVHRIERADPTFEDAFVSYIAAAGNRPADTGELRTV